MSFRDLKFFYFMMKYKHNKRDRKEVPQQKEQEERVLEVRY